jgi:protein SCO1/2
MDLDVIASSAIMPDPQEQDDTQVNESNSRKRVSPLFIGFIVLVFIVTAANIYYGFVLLNRGKQPEPISAQNMPGRPVPDFKLTNAWGGTLSRDDLLGRVWVADFFFTSCPGPCLTLTAKMKELQGKIQLLTDVRLVSFSIDPETDTPEVLKNYAEVWGADPKRWLFLTGDKETIHTMSRSDFLMPLEEAKPGETTDYGKYVHSTSMAVVDKEGMIRGVFNVGEPGGLEALEQRVRELYKL